MEAKSYNGFTGQLIGAMDASASQLTQEALGLIRRNAWCVSDEGDSDFNWYAVSNDFWENVDPDELETLDPAVELEVQRFIDFLAYNNCWWVRIF